VYRYTGATAAAVGGWVDAAEGSADAEAPEAEKEGKTEVHQAVWVAGVSAARVRAASKEAARATVRSDAVQPEAA
jgi:hypothetical protein